MLWLALAMLIFLILLTVAMFLFVLFFGRPFIGGAPYAPTKEHGLDIIIRLAGIKPGDKACDLGSGDGRIVIALARAGAEAHGYEINPFLVWWSRRQIKKAGLTDHAFIHRRSFWKESLADYRVVVVFGITYIMAKLEKKLTSELKPGSLIISNFFILPNLKPEAEEKKFLRYHIV